MIGTCGISPSYFICRIMICSHQMGLYQRMTLAGEGRDIGADSKC